MSAAAAHQHSRSYLVSQANRHVLPAQPGQVLPLRLGRHITLDVPLLAAPMAGITAAPLRLMYTSAGARLAVSEMVIASTLRARSKASAHLARFDSRERLRSVQLYGVKADTLDWACRHLVQEVGVHHIDLNFGCPVRKVTSRGGGSALPLRPRLLRRLVAAAVAAAGPDVPVTVKLRMGLTPELLTFQQAGLIAAEEGAAALTLHARTADQQYDPPAQWAAIAQLVAALPPHVPVIGNGDVLEAADAIEMLRQTGCQGVMIGRAALGRPWLFSEAAAMLSGQLPQQGPLDLAGVLELALQHVQAWAAWETDELSAVLKMRKLIPCYLGGFTSSRQLQARLFAATSLQHWQDACGGDPARWGFDPAEPYPVTALRRARLKGSSTDSGGHLPSSSSSSSSSSGSAGTQQIGAAQARRHRRVVLPPGWLHEGDDEGAAQEALLEDCWAACEG